MKPFEDSQLRASIEIALSKHRAERVLRETKRRYAVTLSNIEDAVIATDGDGRIRFTNSAAETLTGWPQAEAVGRMLGEVLRLVDELTRAPLEAPAAKVLQTRESATLASHTLVRSRDGREVPVDGSAAPIIDDQGDVTGVVIVFRDITRGREEDEAEALREVHARLDRAVKGSNIGVWEVAIPDGDHRRGMMTIANIWEQLGYECRDARVALSSALELVHPDDRELLAAASSSYFAGTSEPLELELRVRHRNDSYRWMIVRGVTVRETTARVLRLVGTTIDITDRKRIEAELRNTSNMAEAANRAKDEFLANVSHEIRTPMNAILGMTEIALDTAQTDDQRQSLRIIKSSAEGLLAIIDDLLDFSKIEAGKLDLDQTEFSLRPVLADTLHALAMRAHRKGLELVCNVRADVPDALVGDPGRLRQVLTNLVGNAIKFTDHGEVEVEVAASSASDEHFSLRITVRDTGIGIAPEKQATVFGAFEQEDTSTTRKYGGTGLGLTIAARLVGLMGGSLTVESEPGRGSTFRFDARVGRKARSSDDVASGPPTGLHDLRVLVVDDNATSRRVLDDWLRAWEMVPTAVGDGMAAMKTLLEGVAAGRPYPLVLLDARMPDADGLWVATKIRESDALRTTRIVLLTAGDGPVDLSRYRDLHIGAHVAKPLSQDKLLETIHAALGTPTPARPPAAARAEIVAVAPLRILVAEDNDLNALLLEELLARRGHRVHRARNGQQALSLLETGAYDLFLLDLHMPELDGFQVIDHLRDRERSTGGHLPVIALTARSRPEDRTRCLAAGMDDFLSKPIRTEALLHSIERLFGPTARDEPASLISPRVLLSALGNDPATLDRVCRLLVARIPEDLATVEAALSEADAPKLREAAHFLCGLVAAFSPIVSTLASDLEDLAAAGDLEAAAPLVDQLRTLVPRLLDQVAGVSLESLERAAKLAPGQ